MISMNLNRAAELLNCETPVSNPVFTGVSIDSRTISRDELFVAFAGEHVDGHDYLDDASRRGAAGAIVSRDVETDLPVLKCEDTGLALAELSRAWRQQSETTVIGVTGSNGKTTVKEMIACILSPVKPTLVTRGNLNNEIGLPLTLCELDQQHRFAVIEMGAGQPGDIRFLGQLAGHHVALITNAGPAHLERLGSVDQVARVKGEIIETLPGTGTVVLNADDDYIDFWRQLADGRQVIDFGMENVAAVSGTAVNDGDALQLTITHAGQSIDVRLHAEGHHNAMNALSAAACAFAVGLDHEQVRQGLEAFRPVTDRLNHFTTESGATLIKDTYNANPASVAAAIGILAGYPGVRVLVLGDMFELGDEAPAFHFQTGALARRQGIDVLLTLGDLSRHASAGFGENGQHFDDVASLNAALQELLKEQVTCLVKGSRGMRMERIADAMLGKEGV